VTCHNCQSSCRKFGKHRNGLQRFRCDQCRKTFTEDHATPLDSMRIPIEKATEVLRLMVEGMSVRSIERITGVHRDTILRLLLLAAEKINAKLRHTFENLEIGRIQVDELHCFVQKRERRVSIEESDEVGEQYTFIGMDADTKLVFSWLTGKRTTANTFTFMRDLYSRTAWGLHPQLTTDGWGPYRLAVAATFRDSVDFAQLQKVYAPSAQGRGGYAPPRFREAVRRTVTGHPDKRYISTSYIERQNLTLRMMSRRFTRLTNAFSKSLKHLKAAITLHFAYYNFCRVHQTLHKTPCMAAGITDHIWRIDDLLNS
jgi:transposase-like protein/IS1 family transposase